jgi:hypothetical protein
LQILLPEFYAEPDAFLDLLGGQGDGGLPSQWRRVRPDQNGVFQTSFDCEWRYIGFPVGPFMGPPSATITRRRILFIRQEEGDNVFRVTIEGEERGVESTSLTAARASLRALGLGPLRISSQGSGVETIGRVLNFYQRIRWRTASESRIVHPSRAEDRDAIVVEIQDN